jgi:predicted nucleotidyltransferase
MNDSGRPLDHILQALQERAKELNCLYRVDEVLNQPDTPLEDLFREIIAIIPAGWQYPGSCRARLTWLDRVYQAPDFQETEWMQSAPIGVRGGQVGRLDVAYREAVPPSGEGPFLKEEAKLLTTIADRVAQVIRHRDMKETFDRAARETARHGPEHRQEHRQEWWIILDFLRTTDKSLLRRIARKMINHLNYSGVQEAAALLQLVAGERAGGRDPEDNRPMRRQGTAEPDDLVRRTFEIAERHLSEGAILSSIQKWIKEDNVSFLANVLETQDSPLADIAEALVRYRHTGVELADLSLATQIGLRVSLIRRLFTDSFDYVTRARHYFDLTDFFDLLSHTIIPPDSRGKLGGKTAGLTLAARIVEKSPEYAAALSGVKVPKTWYLPSDALLYFIHHNNLEDVYNWKYLDTAQIRQEYAHIVQVFKNSSFPSEIVQGLALALDDFADRPLIVRSSSLLEDRPGSAFSGKYKSLFLANRGGKPERLAALMDAIAEVYASVFGPDPIEYRAERGLLDHHEEMGIMIQEVVGAQVGRYWLPAWSGVAFSNNEFRWSPRIQREDGLVRLVPGLGTRAVDRVADDYPVLIAPGQPGLRANVTPDEVIRYAPRRIDVINLETNTFETIAAKDLLREFGDQYPGIARLVSIADRDRIRRAVGVDFEKDDVVFTFDGLVQDTPFITQMRSLLVLLREKLATPVDIEFASDGKDFYLLQCRPQSYGVASAPAPIPRDIPPDRVVFTAHRHVSNGRVPDITHVVYVDPEGYGALAGLEDLRAVGRAVGRLNKLLPRRQFILMGPGRWGSRGDIRLGVGVTYSDINNAAMLIEIARRKGNYLPDLSFGTHFFQDLVEASIRYLPLYPDDEGVRFNEAFLTESRNILADILPEFASLAAVVRVVDVPDAADGFVLRILMNADQQEAVAMLAPPGPAEPPAAASGVREERPGEDHWRWRLRFAQRIAGAVDAARYAVKGVYIFGSTKNATAGPGSDIDLIVHVGGSALQTEALAEWLDGWSRALAEMNYLRTGHRAERLLDVHFVTDDDIAARTSYAAKIGAVTDAARRLPMAGDPQTS